MPTMRCSFFLLALISCNVFAQNPHHGNRPVDAGRLMSISYGSSSWNADSKKIDSAYLVLRDKASGKIVQIQLEETEPDSSQFVGTFSVNIGESGSIQPEIFIPPKELRNTDKDNKKLYDMIRSNKLVRKPVIWKKNDKGQAMIDVYDTREQAEAALAAYQEQQKLDRDQAKTKLVKPIPSQAAIEAAMMAEKKAALDKLAMEAAKRESERVRLEQIERQKLEEREKTARAASEKERAERQRKADSLHQDALIAYDQGEYAAAEKFFKEAAELEPDNTSYLFKYGVTLYRNQKFNEALVTLKLAQVTAQEELEKHYYMGLTYYRLGELDGAKNEFSIVAPSGDPILGPSSTFYLGVIAYTLENWNDAKKAFETVIDTSQDPRMDEEAEAYLDKIANAMAFQKLREKKFTFTGLVGAMYDSNVLYATDVPGDQGTQTKIKDFRFLTIADIEYRAIFNQRHEWSPHAFANLTNSLKDESAAADPFVYNVNLPYSWKGILWGKGFKLTVKPAEEIMYMAPSNGASTKALILNSQYLAMDGTFVMSPNYFATYGMEYRRDDSSLESSTGPNDADANKYTLRTNHSVFLDKARKEAVTASLSYARNQAKGSEKTYNRIDGGVFYARPMKWNASWNLGVNFYQVKYPDSTLGRSDFNTTISAGLNKPIKEWVTWGITGYYTKNDSTDSETYEYSKYVIMTTATFVTDF